MAWLRVGNPWACRRLPCSPSGALQLQKTQGASPQVQPDLVEGKSVATARLDCTLATSPSVHGKLSEPRKPGTWVLLPSRTWELVAVAPVIFGPSLVQDYLAGQWVGSGKKHKLAEGRGRRRRKDSLINMFRHMCMNPTNNCIYLLFLF